MDNMSDIISILEDKKRILYALLSKNRHKMSKIQSENDCYQYEIDEINERIKILNQKEV